MSTITSKTQIGNGYTAKEIMTTKLITLKPDTDVFDGIATLIKNKVSGAPVVDDDNNLLGIFSEQSCLEVLIDAAYEGLPTNQIKAFMNPTPETISEDTGLLTMAQIFINKRTRRLPVLRDGKVVGQVSRRDLIRAAASIHKSQPCRETTLLYLSAIREMQEAPVV